MEELLQPILSLDLVESFHGKTQGELQLPQVPTVFADAQQYLQTWIPLFLYETYCQLISSKTNNVSDQL